ncbi:MAG: hypothetical protein ACH37Z_11460 [Anaerolineae bacterium]
MKTDLRVALLSVLLVDTTLRGLWPTERLVTVESLFPGADGEPDIPQAITDLALPAAVAPIYTRKAPRTAHLPYCTFAFTLREGDVLGLNTGSLIIDVWDYSPCSDRADSIVRRLRALLHYRSLDVYPTTVGARLFFEADNEVQTGTDNVWRNSVVFAVRAMDAATLATMLTREGG